MRRGRALVVLGLLVAGLAQVGMSAAADAQEGAAPAGTDKTKVYQEQDGLICIEAESASLSGEWELHAGAEEFEYLEGFTGEGCIRFTGNTEVSGPPKSPLTYVINVTDPGEYRLWVRALGAPLETKRGDAANDCYVRMAGQEGWLGRPTKHVILRGGNNKFQWNWAIRGEPRHHTFRNPVYDLTAGKHTLIVEGRAKNLFLDRIVLAKDHAEEEVTDLALEPSEVVMEEGVALLGAEKAPEFQSVDIPPSEGEGSVEVSGEPKTWHKVTLTFQGPHCSETGSPNPFTDCRLTVTFTKGERAYVVPGYFAADGNAADTGATEGNKWRVHFAPDEEGTWTYLVSFRTGEHVAMADAPDAGDARPPLEGLTGTVDIGPTDKTGRDFRGRGRLDYVGEHYLRFAGTGEYFLKQGPDAPENFLAYADFDGEFKQDGHKDNLIKTWSAHVSDWREGDPTWGEGKGKGMIGALNYLASEGMNVFSFLTLNIRGDDRNVFPYLTYDERWRMDVSRLAQWERVFEHADRLGLYLHFKTQETENDQLLDDGFMGPQRRLYYRELIARFAHHLALNWNLGEENSQTTPQRIAMTEYLWTHDPYQHHIVIHNGKSPDDLLGEASKLTGFSLQTGRRNFADVHARVLRWVRASAEAGKPWVVACDEPGAASHGVVTDAERPEHTPERRNALWGTLMAGGAGNEWYFGYDHPHSDLTCQDFRSRDLWWDQCRYALEFFRKNGIPFQKMTCDDGKVGADGAYCLCKEGEVYVVFLHAAEPTELDLTGLEGAFEVQWYNPREGGDLQAGSVATVEGGGPADLGAPPNHALGTDWVVLVRRASALGNEKPVAEAGAEPFVLKMDGGDDVSFNAKEAGRNIPELVLRVGR